MSHIPANWSNLVGALAVVGLGLCVLSIRPRTAATRSFAAFGIAFGGYFATTHALVILHLAHEPWRWVLAAFSLPLLIAIGALLVTFPPRTGTLDRRRIAGGVFVAVLLTVPSLWLNLTGDETLSVTIRAVLNAPAAPMLFGYLVYLALEFRACADERRRRQLALTAGAVTLFVGFVAGYGGTSVGSDGPLQATGVALARALLRAAVLIAIVLVWLAGTKGPASGLARNLAILTPATMLLGLVLSMGTPTEGGHGLMRLLMTAVLAYAILQHQLLGIDVKLRWGISKTTVAAVFIAVFFIASEAAQQFFGDRFESSYLGILAAGALVFAIAPLSRVADRLAEKAVPVPASASMPPQPSHLHERYRVLMRRYLGDGRLNRDEELALAHAAAGMGIPTHIALQLRHEVEDENAFERLAAEQDVPADAAARRR